MTPALTDEMVAGMDDMSSDHLREELIAECGRRINTAYRAGDFKAARQWLESQTQAIKGRSAAQVALMEKERGLECKQ